ncbi:MAG: sulfite exporter TauE/SafE family protein [Zoogloeaceae bacterium]|jgi:sulfite exporter TauE/SafE|nr:sulfite exporter TauE/SafE family protein [Zoogloeaceae bacterium]
MYDLLLTLWIPFTVGILGGAHCFGMCGGIVGALSMTGKSPRFSLHLAYNLGRVTSYALAGAVAGALGAGGMAVAAQQPVRVALLVFAHLMLLAMGLYLMGATRALIWIEKPGRRLWRRIQPWSQHFMPVRGVRQAFPLGLILGWLPCGLVYSVLASALGAGSPQAGALVMLAFGLGTLPNLLLAGFLLSSFRRYVQARLTRLLAGALIFAYGLYGLYRAFVFGAML